MMSSTARHGHAADDELHGTAAGVGGLTTQAAVIAHYACEMASGALQNKGEKTKTYRVLLKREQKCTNEALLGRWVTSADRFV
jgi:hypothetical protein